MRKPIPYGKYFLIDRINVGGMAEVFKAKAYGVEGFEKLVAIKRILPNIAEDEEFITMFIDEAKIAVQLNHANIAQIFDLGKIEDTYFIALEFVYGKDLRAIFERLRKRGEIMPIPAACYIIIQVCEGLDYAHRKKDSMGRDLNIVHRDVSPQNILVSYEGDVKVIDFGIAKAANKASKTQAGILKGKFGYMSPEQVRGLPLDRRSDIFSLGIIFYEILTGERLFVGESDFSTLEKVRNVEIMPPTAYNRNIPESLEKIILKALAKDADDRYQFASEMAEDIQRFMISQGILFTRKDLSNFMKTLFADDIARDSAQQEESKKQVSSLPQTVQPVKEVKKPISRPSNPVPPPVPGELDNVKTVVFGGEQKPISPPPLGNEIGLKAEDEEPIELATEESTKPVVKAPPKMQSPIAKPKVTSEIKKPQTAEVKQQRSFNKLIVFSAGAVAILFLLVVVIKYFSKADKEIGESSIEIFYTPPDSEIYIDGIKVGSSSPYKNPKISAGKHTIEIKRKGFIPIKEEVFLKSNQKFSNNYILKAEKEVFGTVEIETIPPGAVVTIDGQIKSGTTPMNVKVLALVDHKILIEKSGYKSIEETFTVDEGKTIKLSYELKPPTAKLIINSTPKGATVFINKKRVGVTPFTSQEIKVGEKLDIEISKPPFAPVKRTITIEKEGELTIDEELKRQEGSSEKVEKASPLKEEIKAAKKEEKAAVSGNGYIAVSAYPWAYLFIDGKELGIASPALKRHEVKAGPHTVTLRRSDGKEAVHKVNVRPNEEVQIKEKFDK
ncbi:MAG: PEGA domain-containing protein [Deltaproteobacteria bacterium]|nr:PEGA domain-containing protein [Deltaproteobacteria bacterium]